MDFTGSLEDPHSFAKPELARVTHISLELKVNFDEKVLKGIATLTIEKKPSINEIYLDNNGLVISNITSEGIHLNYTYPSEIHAESGTGICVHLQSNNNVVSNCTKCTILIQYETSPNSAALYWLTPAQTADNLHPFLFSNNKLIHARTMYPCQDTPSAKFTYDAKISVPKNFEVIMSALLKNVNNEDPQLNVYEFHQVNPVPSYAVILVVGSLQKVEVNENTNIFVERKFITKNLYPSDTIEKMLEVAESVCGSYYWSKVSTKFIDMLERFDICVLPPSIAHFAVDIECPCVTFISPTYLGGDISCIYILVLNLSRSWAGNSVTCSNYEHLWLNRSFSYFIYNKIMCKILKFENTKFFQRMGVLEVNSMVRQFKSKRLLKCLLPNLKGLSPHEATIYVPYKLGCETLHNLEDKLGSSVFEQLLKFYFIKFQYKSINTQDWINFFHEYISDFFPGDVKEYKFPWKEVFYNIISPIIVPEMTTWEAKCYKLAEDWMKWNWKSHLDEVLCAGHKFCDVQKFIFIQYLYTHRMSKDNLILLSHTYSLDNQINETRFSWLLLCIKMRWTEKFSSALKFAVTYCSPNYARPIFQRLYELSDMQEIVIKTYKDNKEKMLYETQKELEKILKI